MDKIASTILGVVIGLCVVYMAVLIGYLGFMVLTGLVAECTR